MKQYHALQTVLPGLLLCCMLIAVSCSRTQQAVTLPTGYRVTIPEASQTLRMRPLPLTVRVTDAEGAPVDEMPVQFRMPDVSSTVAVIEPPTVVTRGGKATAVFRSRSAGHFGVDIAVAGYRETVSVTVLGDTPRF